MNDAPPPPQLSNRQVHAIGFVTAYSTLLESVVDTAIWFLLGLDEKEGRAITSELTFASRLHLLKALGRMKIEDEAQRARFDRVASEVGAVHTKRDRVVHAIWHADPPVAGDSIDARFQAVEQMSHGLARYKPERIEEIGNEIYAVADRLQQFFADHATRRGEAL